MSRGGVGLRWVLALAGGVTILLLLLLGLVPTKSPSQHLSRVWSGTKDGSLHNVHNATLGFQKIFVLNLPSRTDHRDAISLAAHFTGLQIEYVDGVTDVDRKTLPPGSEQLKPGVVGSWRAHMNALRSMVEQNIETALILEDDVDWDTRIKSQMADFARASRLLLQPSPSKIADYLGSDYSPYAEERGLRTARDFDIARQFTAEPTTSPYGNVDQWDLLWLGHCGSRFPKADDNTPMDRAVILNDETVPETQHIDPQYGDCQPLFEQYPNHTRVVTRAHNNVCTLAYGISLVGARRFLYELAMRKISTAADIAFRDVCDGNDGRPMRKCLSVHPQLFQHHRPIAAKSSFSDIGGAARAERGRGYTTTAFTRNIRWSTRVNFPQLLDGGTNYTDLFEDGQPRPDLHYG